MNRKDYDEYKEVAKEAIKLLIATRHLPLIFYAIDINPGQETIDAKFLDLDAMDKLDKKYGMARPLDKKDDDRLTVGIPALFWEDKIDNVDAIYKVDASAPKKVKVMCRVGSCVVNSWRRWRETCFPDLPDISKYK